MSAPDIIDAVHQRIERLLHRRRQYQDYLRMKVREEDWHGVADAANDLREVDAALDALRDTIEGAP